MDHYHSEDNDPHRALVASRHRGWAGEELEMNHTLDQNRHGSNSKFAAVDLNQFRNTIVGVGYQAKGVIRQRSGSEAIKEKVTKHSSAPKEALSKRAGNSTGKKPDKKQRLESYLQCVGIREFRRQIEEILSSESPVQR